jgi:hypothetical protein
LRFYIAAHRLDCRYVVDICAERLADRFRGKTVRELVDEFGACDEADVLCDDLGHRVLRAMPLGAAVTLCEKFGASRLACRAMSWRTAARLLDVDLSSRQRNVIAFQLASPVRAAAVSAARASVAERGAHAAEAVHRALEEFAPGGLVRDAADLPACIELRALADEHYGPWTVPEYAAQAVARPVILHVQARLEARSQPLGVRNIVHVNAGPGCCKTTTARALVKWPGEAAARHYEDDLACRAFLLEVYKARTRLAQVDIVDDPGAPRAVRPVGGFDAAEVARVMAELDADPARRYGAGAARKAAIVEAIMPPDARRQQCWGSITRWLLRDNERREGRWEPLAHGMGALKVRCCGAAHGGLRAAHAFKQPGAAARRGCVSWRQSLLCIGSHRPYRQVVGLDEAQGAGVQMQLAAKILVQSGVLVLLLGDSNRQNLVQGTLNLFDEYPVAHPADAFALRMSFRLDAEEARAYNAALIPREPGQAVQPLVCGFGPARR